MVKCGSCGKVAWKATKTEQLEDEFKLDRRGRTFEPVVGWDSIEWRFTCAGCGGIANRTVGRQLYELVELQWRVHRDQRDEVDSNQELAEEHADPTILEE